MVITDTQHKAISGDQGIMTLQKMKVYELAKEFGMESIALLERLRQLDIDVKSHMSSLGTEEIRIIRDNFSKEKVVAQKTAKAVAKKVATAEGTTEKRVTSTVIRRRVKAGSEEAEGATETTEAVEAAEAKSPIEAPAAEPMQQQEAAPAAPEPVQKEAAPLPEVTAVAPPAHVKIPVEVLERPEAAAPAVAAPTMTVAPAATAAPAITSAPVATVAAPAATAPASPEAAAARAGSAPRPRTTTFSFDIIKVIPKGTKPENTPPGLRTVPSGTPLPAPRPRSEINVVAKAQPGQFEARPRPGLNRNTYHRPTGGPGAPRPGGFRPSPPGARPGFMPPPMPTPPGMPSRFNDKPRFSEEEARKKAGVGRGEKDPSLTKPEDVKLGDYRAKKEIIFLPRKKRVQPTREVMHTQITKPAEHKRVIKIENTVTVADLANRMSVRAPLVIKKLIAMGVMANLNQTVDFDTATLIGTEFGFEVENVAFKEETFIAKDVDVDENMKPRPPVVTVMGHVDHGKTSLLDAIRKAEVAAGEAGGITQHIGAYTVQLDGKPITFIDTPGHAAFTQMRARGASVTDIVILVVAADDGMMPQTKEAIEHSKAAGVPIVVAVNKIDKPTSNRERILKELAEMDMLPEEWGGQTMVINVSALKKTGIKELLEAVLLQAEILDLKANPDRLAEGSIIEAKLDKSRGPTATVLVKRGTLNVGDTIVAGAFVGRVRAMVDHNGDPVKTAGPSSAAEVLGLEGVPAAGDVFNAVKNDTAARELQAHRLEEVRKREAAKMGKLSLEEIFSKIQKGDLKELPLILKTDVFGSTEAIKESLLKLSTPQVKVKVLTAAVGGITESDVLLASASNAIIFGFNVRPETSAVRLAAQENVTIKTYAIIYELIDDVKKAMAGLLPKRAVEKYLGRAEVRSVFTIPSVGVVAGCAVIDGKIQRNAQVRLLRESRVIFTGKLASLRRFKDDAKEVAQGYECGMGIENYRDIKVGDLIEAFIIEMVEQDLESAAAEGEKAHPTTAKASTKSTHHATT